MFSNIIVSDVRFAYGDPTAVSMARSLVLPNESEVVLLVRSDHMAALSIDGQPAGTLAEGDRVVVDTTDRETFTFRKEAPVPQPA